MRGARQAETAQGGASSTRITALLLDIDDTLLDTRSAMRRAAARCIAQVWPEATDRAEELGVRYHADPGGFFGGYTRGELTFGAMRESRLREVATHGGLPWGAEAFAGFEQGWPAAFRAGTRAFDDVAGLLDRARADGILVGALTNSSTEFTTLKLEVVGLSDAFTAIATTDTLGYGKPDARAFWRARELLGSAPEQTVYVGDDLAVDAQAAVAAGLHGVWLDRRGQWGGSDVGVPVVASLDAVSW
ncbi:HAD-IA family hydrolase [Arsenicicoccus sp. MKL-02]|uniref:HAD-IA family hydrolase n=1 Tax=Arsenicicoccus cauae TaxID=2663847 RepID=A0A6I3I7N1_9MICO|nr:HAD family hydrolase [Arsenicicoccus cauae]MTB72164.1 HAD-IA family hydrolase [Arsenicicoccus cauae]